MPGMSTVARDFRTLLLAVIVAPPRRWVDACSTVGLPGAKIFGHYLEGLNPADAG